ncbi:hypothetical protein BpHYR1_026046 [Brachionus plicatilis]|uniref:Uncharacterized protein n=1 Tax=Brachionus plicatilis TaxID=10195 RepID=A0A3M7T0A5_BRAPC|nr:hypothetical protein BpHYR1_026046 [Brachionus plicatilis]
MNLNLIKEVFLTKLSSFSITVSDPNELSFFDAMAGYSNDGHRLSDGTSRHFDRLKDGRSQIQKSLICKRNLIEVELKECVPFSDLKKGHLASISVVPFSELRKGLCF